MSSTPMETPPPNPPSSLLEPVPFGRPMRDTHFLLHPSYNPLNHGAYGTYPRYVQHHVHHYQSLAESRPDAFTNFHYPPLLNASRSAIADFFGVPTEEIVFVPNATNATTVVLSNLVYQPKDCILHLSTLYAAVEKLVEYLKETRPGLSSINVPVEYPCGDDELLQKVRLALQKAKAEGQRVRVAVFDNISSMPALRVPWERLVKLCKEEGVFSLVDAAHGAGQTDLDIKAADPDFLVTNLHKWLFVPRPVAAFYVPLRNQHLIRTTIPTSHGFRPLPPPDTQSNKPPIFNPLPASQQSPFVSLFEFVATANTSAYCCIPSALRFRRDVCGGEEAITRYCIDMAGKAGKLCKEAFQAQNMHVEILDNPSGESGGGRTCAIVQVSLPLSIVPDDYHHDTTSITTTGSSSDPAVVRHADIKKTIDWLQRHLLEEYDTYAPFFFHAHKLWVRFSGIVYVEVKDYETGVKGVVELVKRVRAGEVEELGKGMGKGARL